MTWYAIAIAPSSTRPAKTVKLSRGPRNGLIRENTFDQARFEIERELTAHGFSYFVPADILLVRDRKNGGYVMRRFPMLRGYAFIQSPHDWPSLEQIKGVSGLLGCGNVPIRINASDIDIMRLAEIKSRDIAEARIATTSRANQRITRSQANKALPRGAMIEFEHPALGLQIATVEAVTGRETVKAMAQFLGGLVPVELPLAQVRLVA